MKKSITERLLNCSSEELARTAETCRKINNVTAEEYIETIVSAHSDMRWMDSSELRTVLTSVMDMARKEEREKATEKEKAIDALKKDGKCWNAEKKCIEDIKKEYQFKPFDRVLVRDDIEDLWEIDFFSHKVDKGQYACRCLDCYYIYCIPFEGNEHLLGTNKNK